MKIVRGIRTLALSALIFTSNSCTSDGTDPVETVEEENRVPDQTEEGMDPELPSPEAASAEAVAGAETIDSNSTDEVQQLEAANQLAIDESANAVTNAGQEIPVAGAEGTAPSLPEAPVAPIAVADMPAASPEVPTADTIPTIAESDPSLDAAPAPEKKVKSKKAKKGKRAHHAGKSHSAPLSGNEKAYIVQPGDTLGSISTTLYGSSKEWKNLAELNGVSGHIYPGDTIKYNPSEATAAYEARYDGLAKASVTVERGDTLSKIAARVMGQASFWKQIWHWNEQSISDPNKIAVGQTLQYVSAQDLETATSAGAAAH